MANTIDLKPGDCGSWVIDSISQEVYGYIVALDMFEEAYVVPLGAAFRDIQKKLRMKSVSVPTSRDILRWLRLHNDVSSFVVSLDDLLQDSADNTEKGKCYGRKNSLPTIPVLSYRGPKSHQTVLNKYAVEEQWPELDLSIKSFPKITQETAIRPSFLDGWKSPHTVRESFEHVSFKAANLNTRTEKPSLVSEPFSWQVCSRYFSQYIMPTVEFGRTAHFPVIGSPLEPQRYLGTDSGYGSARSSAPNSAFSSANNSARPSPNTSLKLQFCPVNLIHKPKASA